MALTSLLAIVRGESFPAESLTATMRKSETTEEFLRQYAIFPFDIFFFFAQFTSIDPPRVLFGSTVTTGPLSFHSVRARIADTDNLLLNYAAAGDQDDIPIRFLTGELLVTRLKLVCGNSMQGHRHLVQVLGTQ